jgi:hypothetical protein
VKDLKELLKNLSVLTTGGVMLVALLLLVGVWRSGDRFFKKVEELFTPPPATPKVDVRSVVVRQVQNASELTTAVFAMEAVVPTSQDQTVGSLVIGTTRLLYIAYGEVRAGVDLSQLQVEDVQVSGDTVRLRLPPPRLLDSKIDVARSSVYDYNRGFLGLGPDVAPKLQELAQQEALRKIQVAACSNGVLDKANDRAKLVVVQLLSTVGDKEVQVETQPPAPNACPTS